MEPPRRRSVSIMRSPMTILGLIRYAHAGHESLEEIEAHGVSRIPVS